MKRNRYILLAAAILAAMSTVSCKKETPYYTETSTSQETTQYNLSVGEVPSILKEGTEETFSVVLKTNLPATDLVIETDSWIGASIMDGALTISVGCNETKDIRTGRVLISDRKGRVSPVSFNLKQDYILTNAEGMVQFKDKAFKKAMLALADKDGDGDISMEEALAIEVIDAAGLGISDISGIESFQNIWKLDLGNNDIEDATLVKEHPYLHWLNLKGNKNLKTFDVRGCSMYFEFCDFEVTESLSYQLYYRQMGVTETDFADWKQKWENSGKTYDGPPHSHHSVDPRKTRDWTREGEMNKISTHSKGNGKLAIVLSGIGYIDRDIEDGTFDRIMNEAVKALGNKTGFKENWEYFDVYVMYHMAMSHSQWMHADDSQDYINERRELIKKIPTACDNDYCYCFLVDSHSNMAFEEFLVQQLPAITYKNGDYLPPMTQMCPIPNFDSDGETIYPFHHVDKIIDQYISFDCIQSMNWTWK